MVAFGAVHGLVNNAIATNEPKAFVDITTEDFALGHDEIVERIRFVHGHGFRATQVLESRNVNAVDGLVVLDHLLGGEIETALRREHDDTKYGAPIRRLVDHLLVADGIAGYRQVGRRFRVDP